MDLDSKQHINDFYKDRIDKFGFSKEAIVYKVDEQMRLRYTMLVSMFKIGKEDTILDIGCGLGYFCDFLRANGFTGKYTGFDINSEFIEYCRKTHPNDEFEVLDIQSDKVERKFDYVFCGATLQIRPRFTDGDLYFKDMAQKMFYLCNKGLAFDLFNANTVDFKNNDDILYLEPALVVDTCYALTRRVVLRSDARPFELMVYLLKEDEIDDLHVYKNITIDEPVFF